MIELRWGQLCITGNFRDNNEDNCLVDDQGRFFLVADGMGGQSAGEKASGLAVDIVPRRLEKGLRFDEDGPSDRIVRVIDDAVREANNEIMALGEVDPDCHQMGTTIVYLVRVGRRVFVGGIGDSRVYLLRDGQLVQLTKDHSLTQALLDAGTISAEDAKTHRYRNVLYRYLGTKEGGNGTEPKSLDPRPGDRFVLCSDGVTDGLADERLQSLLVEQNDPQAAAEAIVAAAQEGGSKDNITCVVVHAHGTEEEN
jgi:serine/threonine protein phosphatase PrpC